MINPIHNPPAPIDAVLLILYLSFGTAGEETLGHLHVARGTTCGLELVGYGGAVGGVCVLGAGVSC